MATSVAETKLGTTTELKGQQSPGSKDGTPDDGSKVSSENTPKYTEKEVQAAVHAARSEGGREKKALETQVATLNTQLQNKDAEIAENATEIEKLQEKFDAMAADDPSKFDVAKELKAAREERKQLRVDKQVLDAEKTAHGEQVKLATDTLREIAMWDISLEYENGDATKLKDLCETFSATSDEQIRKVADTLWTKKLTEPVKPGATTVLPYSGRTTGGGGFNRDPKNPDATLSKGFQELRKK